MRQSRLSLALAASLGLSFPLLATAQSMPDDARALDSVTVTGTRTAVTVDAALAATEVIDRAEIERLQPVSLVELLRGRAGINLVNQGGAGKLTTLFLRGTESDHVLFLVDGVRVGSPTSGLASLQDLPIAQIERIEIVRGPRSSLYGADAIGGVIQIFTRRARNGYAPRARVAAGSYGRREASAGFDGGGARGWFGIDLAHQSVDGFNACEVATPTPWSGGCFISAPQPDADGYENNSALLRGGWHFGNGFEVEARALEARASNAYDGDFTDASNVLQRVLGARAHWRASDRVDLSLDIGRNDDRSDNLLQGRFDNRFATRRDSASLQGDFAFRDSQLLTLGIDWLRDRAQVEGQWTSFDALRRNRGGFLQYQGRFGAHDLQASWRHDENGQFGGHDTGNLAWGWSLGGGWRATASAGTAFKAPNFNELYYPYYGNPDLRPEHSRSIELGLGQRSDAWHWQFNAFRTRIDDLISYDASVGTANNLDRARIRGAELVGGATLAGWRVNAQASWADPRSLSGATEGNRLPRRARATGRIDVDRDFGRWDAGASWIAEGTRYDDFANRQRLPGYATLDLRAGVALGGDWRLQAGLGNVFDRRYQTAMFYPQPGRSWTLGLRYQPRR